MKEIDTIREALEYYMEIEVSGPGQEALVALEAIDPDAIRRECADIAEKAYRDGCSGCGEFDFTGCVYAIETGNPSVIAMAKNCDHVKSLRAAIMSAGKEGIYGND